MLLRPPSELLLLASLVRPSWIEPSPVHVHHLLSFNDHSTSDGNHTQIPSRLKADLSRSLSSRTTEVIFLPRSTLSHGTSPSQGSIPEENHCFLCLGQQIRVCLYTQREGNLPLVRFRTPVPTRLTLVSTSL